MTMNPTEHPVADRALGAATLCEAFQITAAQLLPQFVLNRLRCAHRARLRRLWQRLQHDINPPLKANFGVIPLMVGSSTWHYQLSTRCLPALEGKPG
jgi:hypothetical protein